MAIQVLSARLNSILDYALPAACAGCGDEGAALCPRCAKTLGARLALRPGVAMGLPSPAPLSLSQLEWCAPFSGPLRSALHQLKYSGERRLSVPLGASMAARWRAAGAGGDLLVPVPVHAKRAQQRGYDQAVLLAAAVSERLSMPWLGALARSRHTRPQFDLGRTARRTNVQGAFRIVGETQAARVNGNWIVLVDDVSTTGSTLSACAAALFDAGAIAVSALTAARER